MKPRESILEDDLRSRADKPRHESVLAARGVSFSYDKKLLILDGIDLNLQRGLVTMILGRSGSGKTTLLRVLAGILREHGGSVHRSRAVRLAYIPQTLGLVRRMTALENVMTGFCSSMPSLGSLCGYFPKKLVNKAEHFLETMGIGHKANESVFNLSGGERQRVAIARAMVSMPDIVLADEFVSQLDIVTAQEILGLMRAFAKKGTGFLVTTHDVDIVKDFSDRLVVMRSGRVIFDAMTLELTKEEMVQKLQ